MTRKNDVVRKFTRKNVTPKTPTPKRKSTHTYNDNLTPLTSTLTSILANPRSLACTLSSNLQTLHSELHVQFFDPRHAQNIPSLRYRARHANEKRPLSRRRVTGFGLRLAGMVKLVMDGGTRMCTRRVLCETRCLTCICIHELVFFVCFHFSSCSHSSPCRRKASISINHQLPVHWQDPKRRAPDYCSAVSTR